MRAWREEPPKGSDGTAKVYLREETLSFRDYLGVKKLGEMVKQHGVGRGALHMKKKFACGHVWRLVRHLTLGVLA